MDVNSNTASSDDATQKNNDTPAPKKMGILGWSLCTVGATVAVGVGVVAARMFGPKATAEAATEVATAAARLFVA